MKHLTKILFMAISVATLTQNIQAQTNTFPSSGSAGIGTTSPTIGDLEITSVGNSAPLTSLDIHTGYNDATGFNAQSIKITNQMDDGVTFSPTDPENYYIFSVWREWMHGGAVTNTENFFNIDMWGDAQFNKSLTVGNNITANSLSITNDMYSGNDITVGNDLYVNTINAFGGGATPKLTINADVIISADIDDVATISTTGGIYSGDVVVSSNNMYSLADFHASGDVYGQSFIPSSDRRFKKDIETIPSIKEKLFKIIPYKYHFNREAFPKRKFNNLQHYGFIAQDVQQVFPDLAVVIDSEGYLGVNYTEFIPMLLSVVKEQDQTIQTQEQEINELKSQLADLDSKVKKLLQQTGIHSDNTGGNQSTLEQNVPNPFNAETHIRYSIAGNYSNAYIGVYDLSGKEIKKLPVNHAKGEIIIPANGLQAGIYIYSLLVDGQLINTRKMAITE